MTVGIIVATTFTKYGNDLMVNTLHFINCTWQNNSGVVSRAANIVLLLVLMYLPKILILKYSKIPR